MNLVRLDGRIRDRQLDRRLTLEEVAVSSGLTRSRLSKFKNFGITPPPPALGQIAPAPGVTVSTLTATFHIELSTHKSETPSYCASSLNHTNGGSFQR